MAVIKNELHYIDWKEIGRDKRQLLIYVQGPRRRGGGGRGDTWPPNIFKIIKS